MLIGAIYDCGRRHPHAQAVRRDAGYAVLAILGCIAAGALWPILLIMLLFDHFCCSPGRACFGISWEKLRRGREGRRAGGDREAGTEGIPLGRPVSKSPTSTSIPRLSWAGF